MQKDMIDQIFKQLKTEEDSFQILFSEEKRNPVKIDIAHFEKINPILPLFPEIAFIDGGNAELLGSANFSLQIIRLGCFFYQGTRLILTTCSCRKNKKSCRTLFYRRNTCFTCHKRWRL